MSQQKKSALLMAGAAGCFLLSGVMRLVNGRSPLIFFILAIYCAVQAVRHYKSGK